MHLYKFTPELKKFLIISTLTKHINISQSLILIKNDTKVKYFSYSTVLVLLKPCICYSKKFYIFHKYYKLSFN